MSEETNHEALDQGPCTPDWEAKFPFGITVPLATHCIEQWINTEHPQVLQTLAQHRASSDDAVISFSAKPPTNRIGWQISYRGISVEMCEFMPMTDQLDLIEKRQMRLRDN